MYRTERYLRSLIYHQQQRRTEAAARADALRRRPASQRVPNDLTNALRVAEDAEQRIDRLNRELNDLLKGHAA